MSVGDGIFWAAALASLVALYLGTKDRWPWRRIGRWLAVGGLMVIAIAVGSFLYLRYEDQLKDKPQVVTDYRGIKMGATSADVLFLKGKPTEKRGDNRWIYATDDFLVDFVDGKVTAVLGGGIEWDPKEGTTIEEVKRLPGNIREGATFEELKRRYGEPSSTSVTDEGLYRILNYEKYNLVLVLDRDGIVAAGITAIPQSWSQPKPAVQKAGPAMEIPSGYKPYISPLEGWR